MKYFYLLISLVIYISKLNLTYTDNKIKINEEIEKILLNEVYEVKTKKKHKDNFLNLEQFFYKFNILIGFNQSYYQFNTPNANSILKWNNMRGLDLEFGGYFGYDIFKFYFSYLFSYLPKGNGTDDDITNFNGSQFFFSVQKADGISHDVRVGFEVDFFEISNFIFSGRVGYVYKKLQNWAMSNGYFAAYTNNAGYFTEINQTAQITNTAFNIISIGLKIEKFISNNLGFNAILDIYPFISYRGDQFWKLRNSHFNLSSNSGFGFKFKSELMIGVYKRLYIKIYSYYEFIFLNSLKESYGNITSKSNYSGYVEYQSFGIGLGLSF